MDSSIKQKLRTATCQDGLVVSAIWIVSFALYIMSVARPALMPLSLIVGASSAFIVGRRIRIFRDTEMGGHITFREAYLYSALAFSYTIILFAVAQWAYFQFIDGGYMLHCVEQQLAAPEVKQAVKVVPQMADALEQTIDQLKELRPIDFALNYLPTNIIGSLLASLPIAALTRK